MTTLLPKDRIVDALAEEFAALDGLMTSLDPGDWSRPTPCPGWDVAANVAHVIGTESMLAGRPNPDVTIDRDAFPHIRNDIGAFNETWVVGLAGATPAELVERYREITSERLAAVRAMGRDEWDAEGFTPAGPDSYGRFMRVRVFDCWVHEQDIRDAVGRPGHESGLPVEVTLDEMVGAMGFVVGKRAAAPKGSTVTFELTGDSGRTFHVAVGDRAALVDRLDGPPTVRLRMPVGTFTRLAGGRVDPVTVWPGVDVAGDEALGRRITDHLGYMI